MTDSEQLQVLRETCRSYLTKSGLKFMVDMDQDFVLMFEDGVRVFVMPRDLPDGRTVVKVETLCNKGMRIDGDLGLFLSALRSTSKRPCSATSSTRLSSRSPSGWSRSRRTGATT
jgi:hypothetical protein